MTFRIADAHCVTAFNWAIEGRGFDTMDLTPERIRRGDVGVQLAAMYCGPEYPVPDPDGMARKMMRAIEEICARSDGAMRKETAVPETMPETYCAMVPSIEGGELLSGSVERLREFHQMGVSAIAITWNHPNDLATPACLGEKNGLTQTGKTILAEMRRLGVAADVSHLNIAGFYDVADLSGPFMATHSCARALCEHTRNLTDEQIRILIEHEGYIGINFFTQFLTGSRHATLDDVVNHIDYIAQRGGIDILGFGSDFDGISTAPDGLQNPAEYPNLIAKLQNRGYSDEDVKKIAGENMLKFFARVRQNA